ncbi:putative retrotransposon gag domain-containing protein [Helianthus anomalus]
MPKNRGRNTALRVESDDNSIVNSRIALGSRCLVAADNLSFDLCVSILSTVTVYSDDSLVFMCFCVLLCHKRLAAIIAKSVAKAVSDVYENTSKSSEGSGIEAPKESGKGAFCFKQFKFCGPKEFTSEEGPTALFHWFDSIEVTLRQSGCPDDLRTLNATGVFQSRALDWWTAERNKRGNDAAYGLSWDELKEAMLEEFCPPHERQKLEDEFWHIQQKDGDNAALTARFKQLSIICPD